MADLLKDVQEMTTSGRFSLINFSGNGLNHFKGTQLSFKYQIGGCK